MSEDFDKRFDGYSEKFGNSWGMNWRAYMILRADLAIQQISEFISEYDNSDYVVAEIGCATGDLTGRILEIMDNKGRYIGGDISTGAIEICKEKFSHAPNARFQIMKIPNIVLQEKADLTICMDVIHYFKPDEYDRCLNNLVDISKQGSDVLVQAPVHFVDEERLWNEFERLFSDAGYGYVYGQLWYKLVEEKLQPLVQVLYIENHPSRFLKFCGWVGYKILSWKRLVELFFWINESFFKTMKSHVVMTGKVYG